MEPIERDFWIASEQIAAGRWVASTLKGDIIDEILIGYWNPVTNAQVDGKFSFILIQGEPCPKLEIFEDGWSGLAELGTPFLEMLSGLDQRRFGRVPSVADVADALEAAGFAKRSAKAAA